MSENQKPQNTPKEQEQPVTAESELDDAALDEVSAGTDSQNQMQAENRGYTAISNIMKTKHDTVKNSISNIR